ncbi:MAG: ferritin-like domain-containing protein [Fuerstiella sp.]
MTQLTESVLNNVLIDMACSFMQYVSESSPWVSVTEQRVGEQFLVIAARQRQDVADIAKLLTEREQRVDFGSFPTEYTDLQFLALDRMFEMLRSSHDLVLASIASGMKAVQEAGDEEAVQLLAAVQVRQKEAAHALKELQQELKESATAA